MTEVLVDQLIHNQIIEAEKHIRRSQADAHAAKVQLDVAKKQEVYWTGRADSLRELLAEAAKQQPQKAVDQPTAKDVQEATQALSSSDSAGSAAAVKPTPLASGRRSTRRTNNPPAQ